jgi:hypothetical protein
VITPATASQENRARARARGNSIGDVNRLVREYGGHARNWIKKKGWDVNGVEWHWYEHHGIGRVEPKIKY